MDTQNISDKLVDIFAEVMDVEETTITASTTPDDVENWDSLAHVRLVMSVEKAFSVRFTNAEIGTLESVGDIQALLRQKDAV